MALSKIFMPAGQAAPLVYAATVVLGGAITPGYSHLHQPVSALFESGAAFAAPISLAFVAYNLLLIAFGAAIFRTTAQIRNAAAMILLNGIFGVVIELTPMDPIGTPATLPGTLHLILAGLLVVTCAAAMALAALSWIRTRPHRAFARLTLGLLALMLASGALAATAAQGWPYLGLIQRITIGSYLVWIFSLATLLKRRRA